MRIEKLELNKIKITFLFEDLKMYNINANKINPDSPELHSFLCEVMKIVQTETNFNPYDGQVVIEATPCGDGLVLMLSKIGSKPVKQSLPKIKKIKAVKKKTIKREYIYSFSDFGKFEEFVRACPNFDLGEAKLYSIGGIYCVVTDTFDCRLSEFGELCPVGKLTLPYLIEHGKLIASGKQFQNIAAFIKENN